MLTVQGWGAGLAPPTTGSMVTCTTEQLCEKVRGIPGAEACAQKFQELKILGETLHSMPNDALLCFAKKQGTEEIVAFNIVSWVGRWRNQ